MSDDRQPTGSNEVDANAEAKADDPKATGEVPKATSEASEATDTPKAASAANAATPSPTRPSPSPKEETPDAPKEAPAASAPTPAADAPKEETPAASMPKEAQAVSAPTPTADAPKEAAAPVDATIKEEAEEKAESEKREAFGAMLEQFEGKKEVGDTPDVGTKVKGRIIQLGDDTSFVDFGGRSEGAVDTHHLKSEEGELKYAVGDEIELFIVEDGDQIVLAPTIELKADEALQAAREAKEKGVPISGKVAAINSGGLEIHVGGLRGFCPFSQIELGYCNEPSAYLGKTVEFLVQQIADGGKNLVLSRKALLRREEKAQAAKLLETLKEGMEREGRVARIQPFGAFVDIGGLEGLVHVSEIQHGHVSNPNDVLKPGQEVRVRILRMEKDDKGRLRIGLSMKAAQPDPWDEIAEQFWQGKKTQGTVVRMQDFGAFVELVPGIDGLVHVSEISHAQVRHPKDVLKVGERVDVTVLGVDTERKRISLSIKDQLAREEGAAAPAGGPEKRPKVGDILDGVIANIKPYGLFIDLPEYGARTRGLCPREETGEKRGTELEKRFSPGTPLKVAVIEVQPDGKIRLSITAVQSGEERKEFESFRKSSGPASSAGAGRGGETAMAEAFKRAKQKTQQ